MAWLSKMIMLYLYINKKIKVMRTKVFKGINTDNSICLFKVENLPIINCEGIEMEDQDCSGKDWESFLNNNPVFKNVLLKVGNEIFDSGYDINEDMFCTVDFMGDFTKVIETIHFQISGDSSIYLVDDLDKFSDKYKTEEGWDIDRWIEL
jgi:hypothetical protein